jgi:TRAP transporter TAXI family solute receptor
MKRGVVFFLSAFWFWIAVSSVQAQQTERITMAGGPPAGVFGIFATGVGTYLSKSVPNLDVSVAATGGSVENTRRVNAKEAEMGLSFSSDLHEAFYGLEKFKDKPLTELRAIGVIFFGVGHLITYGDSDIRTFKTWPASAWPWALRDREPSPAPNESFVRSACGTKSLGFRY